MVVDGDEDVEFFMGEIFKEHEIQIISHGFNPTEIKKLVQSVKHISI